MSTVSNTVNSYSAMLPPSPMVFFTVKTIKLVHILQFVYWQNAKTRRDADLPKASAKRACLEAKQTQLYAKSV